MVRFAYACIAVLAVAPALAQSKGTRFWNMTANTITHFHLAPAGTNRYGPDQTVNDRDGTVDHDERLRITDVSSGRYDAKFQDRTGRTCIVTGIEIRAGEIFTINESDLTDCQ